MNTTTQEWIWHTAGAYRLLGGTVFMVYALITLYHLRQTHYARVRLISEGLKFCGALLLLLTLLQPERRVQTPRTDQARVAVILDGTDSMLTPDADSETGLISRSDWIESLQTRPEWTELAEALHLDLIRLGHDPDAPVRQTDLSGALSQAASREELSAVLLLSDGGHNAPGSPIPEALQLARRQVPIFSVEMGQTTRLPDLILEPVPFPSYTLINEPLILPVRVRSTLPQEALTEVTLRADGETVDRQPLAIAAGQETTVTLRWVPRHEGRIPLTVHVTPHPLEQFPENNTLDAELDVRRTTIRVLLIDSLPRWEYRFLRNALQRDPGIEVTSLLLHPEIGPGSGPGFIPEFPDDPEEWGAFDVIFLGDVGIGPAELHERDVQKIARLVSEQAGGLIFLPGARGGHQRLLGSPLEALMPVELDPALPHGFGNEVEMRFALTREGREHRLTRLHSDLQRNPEIWRNLPGFFWYAGVLRARIGSEVLATHATRRNEYGRIPLLATRAAGNGQVLFLGTDAAYRWRTGVEDLYHYRFWGQVVRWMAHRRHMFGEEGTRIFLQTERPEAGQENRITVVLRGAAAAAGAGMPVRLQVRDPEGGVVSPRLEVLEGGGAFSTPWTPSRPGEHRFELIATDDSETSWLEHAVHVEARTVEQIGTPLRPRLLREMAGITGGESVSMDQAGDLLARLRTLPRQQTLVTVQRLWQHPLWISGVFLFFGMYWIIRKQQGWI